MMSWSFLASKVLQDFSHQQSVDGTDDSLSNVELLLKQASMAIISVQMDILLETNGFSELLLM